MVHNFNADGFDSLAPKYVRHLMAGYDLDWRPPTRFGTMTFSTSSGSPTA